MTRYFNGGSGSDYKQAEKTKRWYWTDYWESWVMNGNGGNDTLIGGPKSDTLNGGIGADSMEGGGGNDRYYIDSYSDVIVEEADKGYDHIISTLQYSSISNNVESLDLEEMNYTNMSGYGNSLDNKIYGTDSATHDYLFGRDGNDSLYGFNNDDYLSGEDNNDHLEGGFGSDTLRGGNGNDYLMGTHFGGSSFRGEHDSLTGGRGADSFVLALDSRISSSPGGYSKVDSYALVTDFNRSEGDKLSIIGGVDSNDLDLYYRVQSGVGSSAVDTSVFYEGNHVAFIQDTYVYASDFV